MKKVWVRIQIDQRKLSEKVLRKAVKKLNRKCKRGVVNYKVRCFYDARLALPLLCIDAFGK